MKSIIESYFPTRTDEPFSSAKDERNQFLKFVDMLCVISVWQAEHDQKEAASRVGACVSDADLMYAMEPHERVIFPQRGEFRGIYEDLILRSKKTVEETETIAPISRLFASGLLSPLEQLSFLLAFSFCTSKKYAQIYSRLLGKSAEEWCPTLGLCLDFGRLFLAEEENSSAILLDDTSYLNSIFLEKNTESQNRFGQDASALSRSILLKSTVYKWLCDAKADDTSLEMVGGFLTPLSDEEYVCHPEVLKELTEVLSYAQTVSNGNAGLLEISGEIGCGKRFLLSRLSLITATPIFAVDWIRFSSLPERTQATIVDELCVREALFGITVYIYNVSEKTLNHQAILPKFFRYSDLLIFGSEKRLKEECYQSISNQIYRIAVPETDLMSQKRLWEEAAKKLSAIFAEDMDLMETVSKYTMNPGRIFLAVQNTVEVAPAEENGFVIHKDALEHQIRQICSVGFGENAKKISTPFDWDDLIIEEESKKMLQMAMNRVRFKGRVNDDFGFGAKLPYGRGVSVVLYGPPGTGKTMAAGVLAKELGLDLYRVDLSQISSKYIGETEKNLGAIFDTAANSNVVLFFDEADSVFARRTDVSSSNDRHANEQTGYLLQRIEEYFGISILATNNMQNFDAAFKRRMTYLIPIGIPDAGTREMLWKKAFPENAPLSKNVDFAALSGAVELSGSSIKNAAIQAAYFAAAENREITMDDIATAADLECVKVGRLGAKNDILSALLKKDI